MPTPPRRPTARMRRGFAAQRAAKRHLEEQGFRTLEENYRCRWGELDIVALDGDTLVAVEVRSRTSRKFGTPEESITPAKARRLILLLEAYRDDRSHLDLPADSRIDVVAVEMDRQGNLTRLDLIRNAVEDSTSPSAPERRDW